MRSSWWTRWTGSGLDSGNQRRRRCQPMAGNHLPGNAGPSGGVAGNDRCWFGQGPFHQVNVMDVVGTQPARKEKHREGAAPLPTRRRTCSSPTSPTPASCIPTATWKPSSWSGTRSARAWYPEKSTTRRSYRPQEHINAASSRAATPIHRGEGSSCASPDFATSSHGVPVPPGLSPPGSGRVSALHPSWNYPPNPARRDRWDAPTGGEKDTVVPAAPPTAREKILGYVPVQPDDRNSRF